MTSRIERARAAMRARDLPVLFVSHRAHIYYLSGFDGTAGALCITSTQAWLISDFRYELQAAHQAPDWPFVKVETTLAATLRELFSRTGGATIGFDDAHLTVALYHQLGGDDPTLPYRLVPAGGLVEELRFVKEPAEIAAIHRAAALTDAAYAHLLPLLRPGITERALAMEADCFVRQQGGDGMAFDTIVACGARCALPHCMPGDYPLAAGDLVVIDMGARLDHYCADCTRTYAIGHASAQAQEIYRVCLAAQQAGLSGLRAGLTGREADALTRRVIDAAGFGSFFGHGTGHGVGLEVHEAPRLNKISEERLLPGMVVTVEPGIYLPDVGGVRIEDLVVIGEDGIVNLTGAPKPDTLPVVGS